MKKQLGASDTFFPVPATLVVSGSGNEANIITVVWSGIVSSTPPTIGISLYKERYSLELIRKTGEFTVNIACTDLVKETDYCGIISGRKTNKFSDTGLTPLPGAVVKSPIIEQCPYNMECKVVGEMELGDWILVLGEIVETHIDEDKIIENKGKNKIDISKVNPLTYCAGIREYWQLGDKVGDAFNVGKQLIESRS